MRCKIIGHQFGSYKTTIARTSLVINANTSQWYRWLRDHVLSIDEGYGWLWCILVNIRSCKFNILIVQWIWYRFRCSSNRYIRISKFNFLPKPNKIRENNLISKVFGSRSCNITYLLSPLTSVLSLDFQKLFSSGFTNLPVSKLNSLKRASRFKWAPTTRKRTPVTTKLLSSVCTSSKSIERAP